MFSYTKPQTQDLQYIYTQVSIGVYASWLQCYLLVYTLITTPALCYGARGIKQSVQATLQAQVQLNTPYCRYLLSFNNVAPDYKPDFTAFLQNNGISVEEGSDHPHHPELKADKSDLLLDGVEGGTPES